MQKLLQIATLTYWYEITLSFLKSELLEFCHIFTKDVAWYCTIMITQDKILTFQNL